MFLVLMLASLVKTRLRGQISTKEDFKADILSISPLSTLVTGVNEGLMLNTLALESSLEYRCAIINLLGATFLRFSSN